MAQPARVINMDDHRSDGPQLEDGFLRIANELEDAILLKIRTFRHSQVVRAVIRKTYGYGKKEDDISLSQIAEMTGLQRSHVSVALRELEQMHVLNPIRPGRFGQVVGLNKRHDQWLSDVTKTVTVTESVSECSQNGNASVPVLVHSRSQNGNNKRQPQKTTPKDNPKTHGASAPSVPEEFAAFWSLYPKREGSNSKADALKAWNARIRSGVKAEDMLAGVKRYAAYCVTKGIVGQQFVKQASSFLGKGEHWTEDWIVQPAGNGGKFNADERGRVAGLPTGNMV